MTPAVSILVPVYNVSNFIERCAHSLFQQTFDDIEYVFVNDCTPDDSIEKLQKVIEYYPDRKPFIQIINHKKNRGSTAARNTAIDNSIGRYITVVDSDDYIELDMIELMYSQAEEEQADMVVSDMLIEYKNRITILPSLLSNTKEEHFLDLLEGRISKNLCSKLVKREFYELPENRVPEGLNIYEDQHVVYRLFFCVDKVVKAQKPFYHYIQYNTLSVTQKVTRQMFENFIQFWQLLDVFLKEKNIYNKYIDRIEYIKVSNKIGLFVQAGSYGFCRQYAWLFRDFEMKYLKELRRGEKLAIIFTHFKLYFFTHLVVKFIHWKNRRNM
jgi:glycosyltransferase involved in cell wall biosynthesis